MLFLPALLRSLVNTDGVRFAVDFAGEFTSLPYFRHVLELLLLAAIEQDQKRCNALKSNNGSAITANQLDSATDAILPSTIEFLDYFSEARDAVIACARKCEAEVWPALFDVVGPPRDLFNVSCSTSPCAFSAA